MVCASFFLYQVHTKQEKNYELKLSMLLFDIGAILFIAGLLNFLYFGFAPSMKRRNKNGRLGVMAILFLMMVAGGVLMMVSHYIVEDIPSCI